jgi:hypothetical protein
MEPIAHGHGEARESPLVTVLRSNHEFGIHASSASCAGQSGAFTRYGHG